MQGEPPDTALCRRYEQVQERIHRACRRAGRAPDSVRLVAVTKSVSAERVRALMACGQTLFGENRVQEALAKLMEVGEGAVWHFIGHLQRNKAHHVVGRFDLIHSVDDLELARELDRRAGLAEARQAILVQLNVAAEPTKSGVDADDLEALLRSIAALPHLEVRGLMAIPPPAAEPADSRRWFSRLRELRDRAAARLSIPLPELSMGMSDDFEVAIEEGATLVRIGTAIWGVKS